MVQHKMKQKTSLPKGVKTKVKKPQKSQGPKKGHNLLIAPKKASAVQEARTGAEVTKIINEKNEEMLRGRADTAVGKGAAQPKKT